MPEDRKYYLDPETMDYGTPTGKVAGPFIQLCRIETVCHAGNIVHRPTSCTWWARNGDLVLVEDDNG